MHDLKVAKLLVYTCMWCVYMCDVMSVLLRHEANDTRYPQSFEIQLFSNILLRLLPECRDLMRSDIMQLAILDRLVAVVWHPAVQLSKSPVRSPELWLIVHLTMELVTRFLLASKYGFCLSLIHI